MSFGADAVRDTEDVRLAALIALRRMTYHEPQAAAEYAQAISNMRVSLSKLAAVTGPDPAVIAAARQVRSIGAVLLEMSEAIDAQIRRGDLAGAAASMSGRAYYDRVETLQEAFGAFVVSSRLSQTDQFTALDRLWSTSILLFVIAVAGLAVSSALLLYYSGRAVRDILELGRTADLYRRGEPIGAPAPRRDEIGLLNAAIHEFVADQELRERQLKRYRLLADVTHDIILFIDRIDLTVVDANAAALAAYGYERSELIGKPTALLHAVDDPIDLETIALSDTPAGLSYEGMHQRSDGTLFPVEVHARTAEVEGRLTIIKTIRDISERRRAAEQISLALQRYHLLASITSDTIVFIDRMDLTIVDANAAALATYGYERDDFIGKPIAILRPPEAPYDVGLLALADSHTGASYEAMHQRSDGTLFPVEGHAHTADVNGRLTIVATIRDISDRRRAAEQVSLALDQAVEASRLESEFVATMSHEIRTPMHGVIGMSELLLETPLGPLQREYASTVKESAQALLAIIDDILDFSKLEASKMELEKVAFDPAHLVASVVNIARGAARDKGLTLHSFASPHVPAAVRGDPTRLRQILMNLVGNAVKFTARGGVTVSTSVERSGEHSVVLAFAVSDTGIGVSPEARERLFEAFAQGDSSTTRRFGGTGLGLSISRRLVELMRGRIWLGEHEGPGSTFCFTARFEHSAERVEPIAPAAGALRVLVLDDDETVLRTLEATLASWGMHWATAADIDAARTQLCDAARSGTPFDVVLIDYILPRSDGVTFAAELGTHPEYGGPASVLITAFDAKGRREAALAAGCAAYLPKPIDPSDLYDAFAEIDRARKARIVDVADVPRLTRILLAEDSALIRRVARFQLEDLQYGVDIVENGEQAVAAVAAGDYELVLMDMRMPEMDGLAATRAIREAERENGRHVVVVALTANVLEGDREACIEAGMDDFLAKPLQLDALRTVLARWLPERV
jgi:PAS domain S-box-containing protein